jgi:hypothetical protein
VRLVAWLYVGPFLVMGGLALFVLAFGLLAVTMQLLAELLRHAGA